METSQRHERKNAWKKLFEEFLEKDDITNKQQTSELRRSLRSQKNNREAGIDGIQPELHKTGGVN